MQGQTTVETAGAALMDVRFMSGEAHEVAVRGHPADLPAERWPALAAVVSCCTVANSATIPPHVTIDLI